MNYVSPPSRSEPVQEALSALRNADRFLISTHVNADGDGAGSEAALAAWLLARGKEVWIVNPTPFPKPFRFFLPPGATLLDPGTPVAEEVVERVDLAVILDTGEAPRIGAVSDLIRGAPSLVIDHHPPGEQPIPGISFRDPAACATGELVYDIILAADGPWALETVQGLYVALLTDTGSFRFSNTSPAAHYIVADLMEKGADPEDLFRRAYGNVPLRKLRLLQASLGALEVDPMGDLAWMTVPSKTFQELGATSDDIEGLVDYPRDIEGVEVGLLFRETVRGATKISFRSNGAVDVNVLARAFGGGGHVKASGALVQRPLSEVRPEVLDAVRGAIRGGDSHA